MKKDHHLKVPQNTWIFGFSVSHIKNIYINDLNESFLAILSNSIFKVIFISFGFNLRLGKYNLLDRTLQILIDYQEQDLNLCTQDILTLIIYHYSKALIFFKIKFSGSRGTI